jgi:hypothetical protein
VKNQVAVRCLNRTESLETFKNLRPSTVPLVLPRLSNTVTHFFWHAGDKKSCEGECGAKNRSYVNPSCLEGLKTDGLESVHRGSEEKVSSVRHAETPSARTHALLRPTAEHTRRFLRP